MEMFSLLDNALEFQNMYGDMILGEPYGTRKSQQGIFLDQIPDTTDIYIVAADMNWAEDVRRKVEVARFNCSVNVMTLREASEFLGLSAEKEKNVAMKGGVPTLDQPVSAPTELLHDTAAGEQQDVSSDKSSWETNAGNFFADDGKRKKMKMDEETSDNNGGSSAEIAVETDDSDGTWSPDNGLGLPMVSAESSDILF